jgi:hypothetical protein
MAQAEVVKFKHQGFGVRALTRQLNMPVSRVHSGMKAATWTISTEVRIMFGFSYINLSCGYHQWHRADEDVVL